MPHASQEQNVTLGLYRNI